MILTEQSFGKVITNSTLIEKPILICFESNVSINCIHFNLTLVLNRLLNCNEISVLCDKCIDFETIDAQNDMKNMNIQAFIIENNV